VARVGLVEAGGRMLKDNDEKKKERPWPFIYKIDTAFFFSPPQNSILLVIIVIGTKPTYSR
jgi:hypothetical protein